MKTCPLLQMRMPEIYAILHHFDAILVRFPGTLTLLQHLPFMKADILYLLYVYMYIYIYTYEKTWRSKLPGKLTRMTY